MKLPQRHFSLKPETAWDYFEYDPTARAVTVVMRDETRKVYSDISYSDWQRLLEARSKTCFIRREFGIAQVTS